MKLRASASQAGASPRSCMTVYSAIHEDREQQNDRQWDADKPKQRTFSETHGRLRCFTADETRARSFGSTRAGSFVDFVQATARVLHGKERQTFRGGAS